MSNATADGDIWDQQAADYELFAHPFTRHYAEAALTLAGGVTPGERVIDIAAGTGALALAAASAGAQVLAIDFSPGMVARLAARLAEESLPNAEARAMDGQALALPDGEFDAAFSIFGVVLFPDWRQGLSEFARVVRPGGRGCLAVWASEAGGGPSLAFDTAFRTAFPDRPAPAFAPGMAVLCDGGALRSAMTAAGFEAVEVHRVSGTWEAPSPGWVIDNVERFFLRFPAYADLERHDRERLRETLFDELARHEVGGRVAIASDALVASGRRR
jgi:SAM-dependent methyltransferase